MEKILTQKYLKSLGWKRDTRCPDGVNRWENIVDTDACAGDWWVSVTFKDEAGTIPDYGVANHYNNMREIDIHRFFERDKEKKRTLINYALLHQKYIEGNLTVSEFEKIIDKDYK